MWTQMLTKAPTTEEILSKYEDVIEGLGCLPGELHLQIDTDIRPVQQLPAVPIPLKKKVTEAILSMEEEGIIAKVTEPTQWISNMVVIETPGKLRTCIDPSTLNKALLRSHYQMPTKEEILPDIAKAKVFSVLDAKDGYWQVKLDEESSHLTTFWTPLGRYRWLRMPFGIKPAPESTNADSTKGMTFFSMAVGTHKRWQWQTTTQTLQPYCKGQERST